MGRTLRPTRPCMQITHPGRVLMSLNCGTSIQCRPPSPSTDRAAFSGRRPRMGVYSETRRRPAAFSDSHPRRDSIPPPGPQGRCPKQQAQASLASTQQGRQAPAPTPEDGAPGCPARGCPSGASNRLAAGRKIRPPGQRPSDNPHSPARNSFGKMPLYKSGRRNQDEHQTKVKNKFPDHTR